MIGDINTHECFVQTSLGDLALRSSIYDVITKIVPDFQISTISDLEVSALPGGITNLLFFARSISTHRGLIVRVFGDGMSLVINRETEKIILLSLSKCGLAPVIYGYFSNGRIEGYIDASTLGFRELSYEKVARSIGRALVDLHLQDINIDKSIVLWSKIELFFNRFLGEVSITLLFFTSFMVFVF